MPAFEHSTQPRPAPSGPKTKYRPPSTQADPLGGMGGGSDDPREPPAFTTNIMKDPRVVKGSTYSATAMAARAEATKILLSQSGALPKRSSDAASSVRLPPAQKPPSIYDYRPSQVGGTSLDLTANLVEQVSTPATAGAETQTSEFAPRPITPPYVPRKTGVDNATQLTDETFDFDVEVGPLLSVLCSKTLEQAMLELEMEHELANLQSEYDRLRAEEAAEKARVAAMEDKALADWNVKKAKVAAEVAKAKAQDELRRKVACVRFSAEVIPKALSEVYAAKVADGSFVLDTVSSIFLPWLKEQVTENLRRRDEGQKTVDHVIRRALELAAAQDDAAREAREVIKREKAAAEREASKKARGKVRISIMKDTLPGLTEDKVVGPLDITGEDTVADLESKITNWLRENGGEEEGGWMPAPGFLKLGYEGRELPPNTRVLDIPGGALSVLAGASA